MLFAPRAARVVAAILASSLIQVLLTAAASACSNGNGFPLPGV